MPDPNLQKLTRVSLVKMVENSVGSNAYRNFYFRDKTNNKTIDVLCDGELSCAAFVSDILTIFGLIDSPHATVSTVENHLTPEYGWCLTEGVQPGDIIIWEPDKTKSDSHEHIGFAISDREAVSNSSESRVISKHHITYGTTDDLTPKRNITRIYKNIKL